MTGPGQPRTCSHPLWMCKTNTNLSVCVYAQFYQWYVFTQPVKGVYIYIEYTCCVASGFEICVLNIIGLVDQVLEPQ